MVVKGRRSQCSFFEAQTAHHSDEGLIVVLRLGGNDEGHKQSSSLGMALNQNATNRERQKSLLLKNHAKGYKSSDHTGVTVGAYDTGV